MYHHIPLIPTFKNIFHPIYSMKPRQKKPGPKGKEQGKPKQGEPLTGRSKDQLNAAIRKMFDSCTIDGRKGLAFVEQGADPDHPSEHGKTLLMTAVSAGWYDVAKRLIELGADVNKRQGENGQTVLMWCAKYAETEEHTRIIKLLLEAGADKTVIWNENTTAYDLHNNYYRARTTEVGALLRIEQ